MSLVIEWNYGVHVTEMQTTAGKLSWQLDAYRFLPQDYVMTAQSRAINVWAFALTALLLLTALYFIWKRK